MLTLHCHLLTHCDHLLLVIWGTSLLFGGKRLVFWWNMISFFGVFINFWGQPFIWGRIITLCGNFKLDARLSTFGGVIINNILKILIIITLRCLDQLETIQTHRSVSDMASSKVCFFLTESSVQNGEAGGNWNDIPMKCFVGNVFYL